MDGFKNILDTEGKVLTDKDGFGRNVYYIWNETDDTVSQGPLLTELIREIQEAETDCEAECRGEQEGNELPNVGMRDQESAKNPNNISSEIIVISSDSDEELVKQQRYHTVERLKKGLKRRRGRGVNSKHVAPAKKPRIVRVEHFLPTFRRIPTPARAVGPATSATTTTQSVAAPSTSVAKATTSASAPSTSKARATPSASVPSTTGAKANPSAARPTPSVYTSRRLISEFRATLRASAPSTSKARATTSAAAPSTSATTASQSTSVAKATTSATASSTSSANATSSAVRPTTSAAAPAPLAVRAHHNEPNRNNLPRTLAELMQQRINIRLQTLGNMERRKMLEVAAMVSDYMAAEVNQCPQVVALIQERLELRLQLLADLERSRLMEVSLMIAKQQQMENLQHEPDY